MMLLGVHSIQELHYKVIMYNTGEYSVDHTLDKAKGFTSLQ